MRDDISYTILDCHHLASNPGLIVTAVRRGREGRGGL